MRVLCAPDKFKQACASHRAARALAEGARAAGAEARALPLADGGEGTLDVLAEIFPDRRSLQVRDPLGREVHAEFSLSADGSRALIESAQACGLWRLAEHERNPLKTHTAGVGELILAALDTGAKEILVGLGGSATSDGGAGMLRALGASFAGCDMPTGETLHKIRHIDLSGVDSRLRDVTLAALCDIRSPLLGGGAPGREYVVQKGGTTRAVNLLREALACFADLIARQGLPGAATAAGSGAAGGLGFAVTMLGGELKPGAETVLGLLNLKGILSETDLVLTGEGSFDWQTRDGKLVAALAAACHRAKTPLVVLAGVVQPDVRVEGVTAAFGISPFGARKQDCLEGVLDNLRHGAAAVVRLYSSASGS